MKKRFFSLVLAGLLALSATGCGSSASVAGDDQLNILATTYPIYLFACSVTEGAENVEVSLLVNEQTSCLHDYTLSVTDMKAIEKADVIILNGAGFETFMEDALAGSKAAVIDCSEGIELLPSTGHHDHNHGHDHGHETVEEHFDPHYWLDPARAMQMMENIRTGMVAADAVQAELYSANLQTISGRYDFANPGRLAALATGHSSLSSICTQLDLITFHDGFQYFADAFDLTLLKAIEEEEGAEASAAEIKEIVSQIKEHNVSALFVEKNGSDSTARAIARETGVEIYALDMIMSGDGTDIQAYIDAMSANLQTVAEALK